MTTEDPRIGQLREQHSATYPMHRAGSWECLAALFAAYDEQQRQINAVERVLDEECIADNVHGDLWIDAETLRAAIAAKVKE
jgi:hypothetical protein